MKRLILALALVLVPTTAAATGFTDIGEDIATRGDSMVEIDGYFRTRGELLNNLDLDHGLTPSGKPLFPVPLSDPNAQTLRHADMRLRTDLTLFSPVGDMAVKMRADVLDNLAFGSTPNGPPASTTTQEATQLINIRRVYGEVLTPVGLLAVGRMGSDWGLGIFTNGGDCADCDSGDAADRIAFITPLAGHIWALSYDLAFVGPDSQRPSGTRTIDLDPADDVKAVTFASMHYTEDWSITRRRRAGKTTFDYGAYLTYRWQDKDVPAWYIPLDDDVELGPEQVVDRDLWAFGTDLWLRLWTPLFRAEFEGVFVKSEIGNTSLIPGVGLPSSITSDQFALALETQLRGVDWTWGVGIDAGMASGDTAPGFGAYPDTYGAYPSPGDLEGPQAAVPLDTTVNNFRFHPDYRIDRIFFREILGTVTDTVYVRPHFTWDFAELGPGKFTADLFAVASFAAKANSTPSGERGIGLELDPSLRYTASDTFLVSLDYAVFFPFSGLDNRTTGMPAEPAQLFRARMNIGF